MADAPGQQCFGAAPLEFFIADGGGRECLLLGSITHAHTGAGGQTRGAPASVYITEGVLSWDNDRTALCRGNGGVMEVAGEQHGGWLSNTALNTAPPPRQAAAADRLHGARATCSPCPSGRSPSTARINWHGAGRPSGIP